MNKELSNALKLLGLTQKEMAFFTASFMLGTTTITQAGKKARLERSTAYLIARDLLEKGLLVEDFREYRKRISPVSPKKIVTMLSARQRLMQRQEIALTEVLPQLQQHFDESNTQPAIRYFEGIRGLKTVWRDILTATDEILLWTNQEKESQVFSKEFHDQFIAERIRKGIAIRALAVNNVPGKKLLEQDEESLRQSNLLPIHTSFSAETYIYDNKVATLDYKKDIIGIIIESEAISSTQRAIFEMTWKSL
jgi:sugar-specific transcriptional regulator TrmB